MLQYDIIDIKTMLQGYGRIISGDLSDFQKVTQYSI